MVMSKGNLRSKWPRALSRFWAQGKARTVVLGQLVASPRHTGPELRRAMQTGKEQARAFRCLTQQEGESEAQRVQSGLLRLRPLALPSAYCSPVFVQPHLEHRQGCRIRYLYRVLSQARQG